MMMKDYETGYFCVGIEYKHGNIVELNGDDLRAHRRMCDDLHIPFLVVVYYHYDENTKLIHDEQMPTIEDAKRLLRGKQYRVIAGNSIAKQAIGMQRQCSERAYWALLYQLTHTPLWHLDQRNLSNECVASFCEFYPRNWNI